MTALHTYEIAFQRIQLMRTRVQAETHRRAIAELMQWLENPAESPVELEAIDTEDCGFRAEEVSS